MTVRCLTPGERQLATSVFADSVDYDPVRIIRRKWWIFQPRGIVMAPRGHIHFHPDCGRYHDDSARAPLKEQALFIHEMTHVWQHQQGLNLLWRRPPFARYAYHMQADRPFHRYGIEQQAEIVRDFFLLRAGAVFADKQTIEVYRNLIPFNAA